MASEQSKITAGAVVELLGKRCIITNYNANLMLRDIAQNIDAAVAAERERCAKICEQEADEYAFSIQSNKDLLRCARLIREVQP